MRLRRRSRGHAGWKIAGAVGTRARGCALLIALLLLIAPASPLVAASGPAHTAVLNWLRVDPLRPRVVYAGGYSGLVTAPPPEGHPACGYRAARSADGGATWQLLAAFRGFPLVWDNSYMYETGCQPVTPFVLSPNGADLFYGTQVVAHSADGGQHWAEPLKPLLSPNVYKWQEGALSISGLDPRRAYADVRVLDPGGADTIGRSDDGGGHWHGIATSRTLVDGKTMISLGFVAATLPDPLARDVVYLGLGYDDPTLPILWVRSADGGRTWHRLQLPVSNGPDPGPTVNYADYPALPLSIDTHLPGAIVLRGTHVAGIPADRRWSSLDHGATWKRTVCPGDLRGACPAYSLDNVFGANRAYGLYADGLHAFAGAGPAGSRLVLSDRLPCHGADVLDAGSGSRTGDPAYLLCQASKGQRTRLSALLPVRSDTSRVGTLYRSTDSGASWRKLDPTAGW